ncbi:MAG: hypothetical protein M1814_000840 [Vezdaea aestivalis]|nr:MAG: hypothetical protein M1814_000840 [Vezdaea aestivalis]
MALVELPLLIEPLALTVAVLWLSYRFWSITKVPVNILAAVLGLEIPPAPAVILTAIRRDAVRIQWAGPEASDSITKYIVKLNGAIIGDTSRSSTCITIRNLEPSRHYTVQIVATNFHSLESNSDIIYVQTRPSQPGSDTGQNTSIAGIDEVNGQQTFNEEPSLRLRKPIIKSASPIVPATAKENNDTASNGKKQILGRRGPGVALENSGDCPQTLAKSTESVLPQGVENGETVEALTRKLEILQGEFQEQEVLEKKEEEEFVTARNALQAEGEVIIRDIQERENRTAELKKEYHSADRANSAAQKKKREVEAHLQAKEDEREKMRQDMIRWDKEIKELRRKRDKIEKDGKIRAESLQQKLGANKISMQEDQKELLAIEEDTKIKSAECRRLDAAIKEMEAYLELKKKQNEESARQWEIGISHFREHVLRLNDERVYWERQTNMLDYRQVPTTQDGYAHQSQRAGQGFTDGDTTGVKKAKNRRSRQRKSRSNTGSSSEAGIAPFAPTADLKAAAFSNNSYFGMPSSSAGMPRRDQLGNEQELAGGRTPMSPSANGFLPSGLLGDDEASPYIGGPQTESLPRMDHVAQPYGGLPPTNLEHHYTDPNSPNSAGSKPHSLIPSPRDSLSNINTYHNPTEGYLDADRRSINSAHASLGAIDEATADASGPRKFASYLSSTFSRREKNSAAQGVPMGTLKSGQSQSFPRNYQSEAKQQDPIGTRARSGSQSTFEKLGLRSRHPVSLSETVDSNAPAGTREIGIRRTRYDPWRSESDPLDPEALQLRSRTGSVSSRPDSARLSTDTSGRIPWMSELSGLSGQSHGRERSVGSDIWAHRSVSRQHSLHQNPSSSSHSLGQSSLGPTQADIDGPDRNLPPAPIGTKPKSIAQRAGLNPTAPSFSLNPFNRSESRRAEKAESTEKKKKDKEKAKASKEEKKEKEKDLDQPPRLSVEDSPPSTRRSRDSRSINTEASQADSRDSLDRSTSGTPSDLGGTTTPSAAPGPKGFIQKLTRKGSSGKFNWNHKTGLFGKKSMDLEGVNASGTVEEGAEGSGESTVGRSVDSATSSPNVGADAKGRKGWGRLSRKRKEEIPASEASEAGDDDEDKAAEGKA